MVVVLVQGLVGQEWVERRLAEWVVQCQCFNRLESRVEWDACRLEPGPLDWLGAWTAVECRKKVVVDSKAAGLVLAAGVMVRAKKVAIRCCLCSAAASGSGAAALARNRIEWK